MPATHCCLEINFKLKKYFFILLLFVNVQIYSQVNLDSLWSIWNDKNQPDTNRLKAIKIISWDGYLFSQPDSAFHLAELQYNLAKKKGLKKHMAIALNTQGASFQLKGDNEKALNYYIQSLTIKEELNDAKGIASSLNNIGLIYKNQGNYSKAIDCYIKSLKIKEKLGNKNGISASLTNIGNIYQLLDHQNKAINYYTKALKIQKDIGDRRSESISLGNIGVAYYNMENYPLAIDYQSRSLNLRQEINDRQGVAMSLNNLGNIYKDQGNYSKAINHYLQHLEISQEIDNKYGIAVSLGNIGDVYYRQNEYNKSIDYCTRSLTLAQEIGAPKVIQHTSKSLYKNYKKTGNSNDALVMFELYNTIQDSLESDANQKEIIRQEYKYEYEKNKLLLQTEFNNEIAISKERDRTKNNILYTICIGLFLLFISLIIILKKLKTIRIQKKEIETKNNEQQELLIVKNTLLNEVHHRVKNNLQIIVSLLDLQYANINNVDAKDQMKQAMTRVNAIAKIHELLYSMDDFTKIDINVYVNNIISKLMSSFIENRHQIQVKIDIEDIKLNIKTAVPLGLIINEIITNSLKHGISDSTGIISVKCKRVDFSQIILEIGDNGSGFSNEIDFTNSKTLGLMLIHNLTSQLKGNVTRNVSKNGTNYVIKFQEIE